VQCYVPRNTTRASTAFTPRPDGSTISGLMSNSARCPSRCIARYDTRTRVSSSAWRSAAGPVRGRRVGIAGGSARTQREHGFRHSVDHAQKGASRTLRRELTLLPTTHRRNRYADPARKLGL
jgi:hypothetical protein